MRYRAEIDGLRAIALVPVVLFHAGFEGFSGGFVGVDIFFVISGYLITSIILSEMDEGKFSLLNFYERRARRILPALFLVLAACIPFAWLWLLPQDMQDFSQSLVAVSLFSSNFLFWLESGYFEAAAELKPLLHTWSLAVEEQYYILFPLFLMLGWKLGKRWLLVSLAVVGLLSLSAAQWTSQTDPSAAFYLLHTRGWEILAGAFVAFYLKRADVPSFAPPVNQALGAAGLALIAYSVFAFDESIPFPGVYALVPVAGAVLLVLFAQQGTIAHRFLSHRLLVGIGLISYSAYLWHQPLFAFAKYRSVGEPSARLMVALCLMTLVLAYLSWRVVEKPFRQKGTVPKRMVLRGAAGGIAVFILVGISGHTTNGHETQWLARQTEEAVKTYKLLTEINEKAASEAAAIGNGDCRFSIRNVTAAETERLLGCNARYGRGVAVLGDSHAIDLYGVVTSSNPDNDFVVGITQGFCRVHTPAPGCQYDEFLSFVEQHKEVFSKVIYEQAGFYLVRTESTLGSRRIFSSIPLADSVKGVYPNDAYIKAVYDYLVKVSQHTPVLWFGSRVEPHVSHKDIFRLGCDYEYKLREGQYEVFRALDGAIAAVVGDTPNLQFLSQNEVFGYSFPADFMTCDALYWSDGDHLSESGERHFGSRYDLL